MSRLETRGIVGDGWLGVGRQELRSEDHRRVAQRSDLGSARNEMRCRARTTNELYLMDAVIEPERLAQISLGQENPRMRMNAAPGSRPIRTRTLKGFHNAVLCRPFRANALLPKDLGRCPRLTCCGPLGRIAVFQWAFMSSWACVVCHTSR